MTTSEENRKTGPKDVFMHLLEIIWLYVGVVSFGTLLFQYINIYFPDILNGQSISYARTSLRWPLAILTVVFPFYLWLSAFLQRDLMKHPVKRDLKTRKWLLYLTLFIATIVIVIDFITLIFQFLSGGLTVRFLLKVLAVLFIAIAVFTYYIWNLRKDTPASADPRMRIFVWGVIGLVSVAIIAGYFVVGTPQSERLRQFDERRASDLQNIQYQIIEYWRVKQVLPEALADLRNDLAGFIPPVDPATGASYEYSITDKTAFELCATFETSNKEEYATRPSFPYAIEATWPHEATRTCFARVIDPDLYPPYTQTPGVKPVLR